MKEFNKIKYAGLRPIISQHGIEYKEGKEDKYVYLMTALEILESLNHNYEIKHSYSDYFTNKSISEQLYHTILVSYDKDLENKVTKEIEEYKEKITNEINTVQISKHLSQIEKDVWCENIKIMTDYRIQRALNKIYYLHCIEDIKTIIIKNKIREIDTPFNEKFWHVLHTIQGRLVINKSPIVCDLKEETQDDQMLLKLYIKFGTNSII